MRPNTRRRLIAEQLAASGELEYSSLAEQFGVSEMTIRRDCELLEQDGIGRRVRGGLASAVSRGFEPAMPLRMAVEADAKSAIGSRTADLIADGETVILDVGTTTLEVARCLRGRMGLTVVTSSLPIALELGNEPGIRVIATGGTVRAGELSLTGGFAEDALRRVNVDVAVLGVAGVDSVVGFTDYNPEDTRVKRLAIESARRVIVVADASKIGKVAFSAVADLSEVDILVTDTRTSPAEMKRLAAQDIEVVIAGANQPR